jgi:hypothetical protein
MYSGKQKSRFVRFASRLVLRIILETYGTLVPVSALLVMPLHDSDILMNGPFTSCNKQATIMNSYGRIYSLAHVDTVGHPTPLSGMGIYSNQSGRRGSDAWI